jgi:hypothetical protein
VATYQSSRFSKGNFWFPDRIEVLKDSVVFHKRHLIGGDDETIRYEQIASVSAHRGVLFSNVLFETTGGTEPVYLNGLWNGDAESVKADVMTRVSKHTTQKEDRVVELLEEQNVLLAAIRDELRAKA